MTKKPREIKCLVWDLDNTLWEGVLLEGDEIRLRKNARAVLETLDGRGILHSIASRNDPETALNRIEELGLAEFFLYPQISWNPKSHSIQKIAESMNIGLDSIAFIDDDPFDREEVASACPEVLLIDAVNLHEIPGMPEMNPRFITLDSSRRRQMYLTDIERSRLEKEFIGPREEFLASLKMKLQITRACEEDLQRAEELTVRTHQLNSTGLTFSYEDLKGFLKSPCHILLMASLEDKFGDYGKIGLALIESRRGEWDLKLLLMSCRVMSRGVGTILLSQILMMARQAGVQLRAELRRTERNRMMLVTFKFAGFQEVERNGDQIEFFHDLREIQAFPEYVEIDATHCT